MRTAIAVTSLILALPLAGCSEPAVCSSADDLRASVNDVKAVDVTAADDLADLQSALRTVESDFAQVKADAEAEFSAPVDAVEGSLDALRTSMVEAETETTAETVAAVGAALSTLGTDVQTLVDDVESTC